MCVAALPSLRLAKSEETLDEQKPLVAFLFLVASLLLVVRPGALSSFLLLVAIPGAPSSFLLLVAMPGAPSSCWVLVRDHRGGLGLKQALKAA